jgi:hypothetical protein
MNNPWEFGWTQLLTIVGLVLTSGFAAAGFRTFGRWKREKLEEKRIEIAFEALSLAFETKHIFRQIRARIAYEVEWRDMEPIEGETSEDRMQRGSYFAVLKRLSENRAFFDRVWTIQPKFLAAFGEENEEIFENFHVARGAVRRAAIELTYRLPIHPTERTEADFELRMQYRRDIWGDEKEDRVGKALQVFRNRISIVSRPVIERKYRTLDRAYSTLPIAIDYLKSKFSGIRLKRMHRGQP